MAHERLGSKLERKGGDVRMHVSNRAYDMRSSTQSMRQTDEKRPNMLDVVARQAGGTNL